MSTTIHPALATNRRLPNVWDAVGINQPVGIHTMAYLSTIYSYDGAFRYSSPATPASGGLVTPVVGLASTPDGGTPASPAACSVRPS